MKKSIYNFYVKQSGQSMVEYTIVLVALTMALLAVSGGSNNQDGNIYELQQAIVEKFRGYSYAVSLSEYPESDNLTTIADYYDSMGRHPEVANQLREGDSKVTEIIDTYVDVTAPLRDFDPDLPSGF